MFKGAASIRRVFLLLAMFSGIVACAKDASGPVHRTLAGVDRPAHVIINPADGDTYKRGIFYFSGWTGKYAGLYFGGEASDPAPWQKISQAHSDPNGTWPNYDPSGPDGRSPWLGWYDEDSQGIVDDQILAMHDAGYAFVAYQVGWSHDAWHKDPIYFPGGSSRDSSYMDHVVKRHLTSPYRSQLKFAIHYADIMSAAGHNIDYACATQYDWCYWRKQQTDNGWTLATYQDDVRAMTRFWFSQWIVNNPDYYKHAGRPVIFIFTPENFIQPNNIFGTTTLSTTNLIRTTAAEFGYSGYTTPFLVAVGLGTPGVPYPYRSALYGWGFDAYTGYHYEPAVNAWAEGQTGSGFTNLYSAYTSLWSSDLSAIGTSVKYFVPNLARYDGRAWNFRPYWNRQPGQFGSFVQASASFAQNNQSRTDNTIMTCCWNEWGEGYFMERSIKAPSQDVPGTSLADEHRRTIIGGSNQTPGGNVDGIFNSTQIAGWALDFDAPSQRVEIRVWWPGSFHPPINPFVVGVTQTSDDSGDVNAYYGGLLGTHRFHLDLPTTCTQKMLTVEARDTGTGVWYPLGANGAAQTPYGPNC